MRSLICSIGSRLSVEYKSTNINNIKKTYYEKILGVKKNEKTGEVKIIRPSDQELQKNIINIFSDKNIPSNNIIAISTIET